MLSKVLMKAGAVRAWAMMNKAVFQTVLLYDSERWVLTGAIFGNSSGFCHGVDR